MASTKLYNPNNTNVREQPLRLIKQRVASSRGSSQNSSAKGSVHGPPVEILNEIEDRGVRDHYPSISRSVDASHTMEHYRGNNNHHNVGGTSTIVMQPQPPSQARTEDNSPQRIDHLAEVRRRSYTNQQMPSSSSINNYHENGVVNNSNNIPSSSGSGGGHVNSSRSTVTRRSQQFPNVMNVNSSGSIPSGAMSPSPRNHPTSSSSTGQNIIQPRLITFQDVPSNRLEIGLENLGNTCFMNSTLQCLLHIEPLVSYFLQGKMESDINPGSPKRGMIAASFYHLIQDIYQGKSGCAIAPVNFQRVVSMFAPYLMDFQQQDSQEFLRFILDGMSEDLCRRRSPNQQGVHSDSSYAPSGRIGGGNVRTPTKSGSAILPSLPHIPNTSPNSVNTSGEPANKPNSIHRLRMETKTMRGEASSSDPIVHLPNANRVSNQEEEETVRTQREDEEDEDGHDEPISDLRSKNHLQKQHVPEHVHKLASATFPGTNPATFSKMGTSSQDFTEDGGNGSGGGKSKDGGSSVSIPLLPTSSLTPSTGGSLNNTSQQDNNNVEIQPSNSSSADSARRTSGYGSTLSAQFRDVLRLRRSRPSSHIGPGRISSASGEDNKTGLTSLDDGSGESGIHKQRIPVVDNNPATSTTLFTAHSVVDSQVEMDAALAWERYLKLNDSIITDIFGGLLQSTIQCLTCHYKSHSFDPFLDISVPISKDGENNNGNTSARSLFGSIRQAASSSDNNRSTLEKCLAKFTAEEVLDGDNMYHCEKCKKKRKSVKQLMIYRYPRVLVIHIKRFRFNSTSREKLSTDVHFPLMGMDVTPFVRRITGHPPPPLPAAAVSVSTAVVPAAAHSAETPAATTNSNGGTGTGSNSGASATVNNALLWEQCHNLRRVQPIYDLLGVSNHHGSLNGGHYIAHVDTNNGYSATNRGQQRWVCFNDARVSNANAASIAGPTAYVLFYRLRESSAGGSVSGSSVGGSEGLSGPSDGKQ